MECISHPLNCVILRGMKSKKPNSHTSTRKKAAAVPTSSASSRSTRAAKFAGQSKRAEAEKEQLRLKKRMALTLKMFQQVYDDYQEGKFQRL